MSLITLAIGVALGAAFSPMWMKLYAWGKAFVVTNNAASNAEVK